MHTKKSKKPFKYHMDRFDPTGLPPDNIDVLSLAMVPKHTRVLELGAATGYHSAYLEQTKHCQVTAVDISATALKHNTAHATIVGDLNTSQLWKKLKKQKKFEVVFASNVLEHLTEPSSVLQHIHAVLQPTGILIAVVPNIAFWRSRLRLLQGRWHYEDYGLFDRTHLRFFNLFSFRQAIKEAGFTLVEEAYDPAGGAKWLTPLLKQFPNAYAYQIAGKAKKKSV